jgi:hypothetical protein
MITLLFVFLIVYLGQLTVIFLCFMGGDFKTKQSLALNLLPFYWLGMLFMAVYEMAVDRWNSLDEDKPSIWDREGEGETYDRRNK